jgi:hypothetical protein
MGRPGSSLVLFQLGLQGGVRGFDQHRPVGEKEDRNALIAFPKGLGPLEGLAVILNIIPAIGDSPGLEKTLGPMTIRTPMGSINFDRLLFHSGTSSFLSVFPGPTTPDRYRRIPL